MRYRQKKQIRAKGGQANLSKAGALGLNSELGASIVSYLVALAVVSATIAFASATIMQMRALEDRSQASSSYNEFEPILRTNVGNLLFNFQKNLVNKRACSSARKEFNTLTNLLNSGVKMTHQISTAVPKSVRRHPQFRKAEPYKEALKRCNRQTLQIRSSLSGAKSMYFCGLLSSPRRIAGLSYLGKSEKLTSFAEFRVSFWDFAKSRAVTCEQMIKASGRGGIVQYTVYFIREGPRAKGQPYSDSPLGLARHSGRFYVPKFPSAN